jgi:DNA-binding beta-propeller fold protein YncE
VTASFAANPTLELPRGLAVDAKGNLYVANSGAHNILIYNSAYALQPSKTISTGISTPWGVAYDRWGNLWVANNGNNSVTEYPTGQLSPATTLTAAVLSPQALAFDPLGDLWVENNSTYFGVYVSLSGTALGAPGTEAQTVVPGGTIYGLAFGTDAIAVGSPANVMVSSTGPTILFGELDGQRRQRQVLHREPRWFRANLRDETGD